MNGQALAVDHPRLRRDNCLFANRRNDAARNDNGGAFDWRPGNGDDLSATNSKVLRLATLSLDQGRQAQEKKKSSEAYRERTPAEQFQAHANLPVKKL